MTSESIIFPNLNIRFENVGRGIYVGGFQIAFYGMVIALGMLLAIFFISRNAKRYGYLSDSFTDITIFGIVCGVIGARLYYVLFSWDMYKDDLISIINLRQGGLAIYGGIIGGTIGVFIMSKSRRIPFLSAADVVIPGVLIGQIFGRFGNFFNREAFGDYSDGLLCMGLPIDGVRSASDITSKMLEHRVLIDGVEFVTVHPTFLYESLWNTLVFIILLIMRSKVKFRGEICMLYFLFYGIGRFFIERLRTDQLLIPNTQIPVSMAVSVCCVVISLMWLILYRRNPHKTDFKFQKKKVDKKNK